ncbi:hypothetical protein GPALN_006577 [Globodera pallida]|nr:hypothetical protein GPALN_006577 [Globodera pallida]
MKLTECPADTKRCFNVTCTLDAEALSESSGMDFPNGSRSTTTVRMCMPPEEEKCEIPDEIEGVDNKQKKYCRMSCCTGHGCNGTLGLHSFGTAVAAMIAFVAAFFLRN